MIHLFHSNIICFTDFQPNVSNIYVFDAIKVCYILKVDLPPKC